VISLPDRSMMLMRRPSGEGS